MAAPRRKRFRPPRAPALTVRQVLAWADDFHDRAGRWPKKDRDGRIAGSLGEKWLNIDMALRLGLRGLPGGSSLARLLAEKRGVRNHMRLPPLTTRQVLAWADDHRRRTGRWPREHDGPIAAAPGETWMALHMALLQGHRGLPGGSSLARLLARERGVRNPAGLARLTIQRILTWADAHHRRTGNWPKNTTGPIPGSGGETWSGVHTALNAGLRGLPGGSTLARLLAERRGVRNHKQLPPLREKDILAWADAHRCRTAKWPSRYAGPIPGSDGETWSGVETALDKGQRGLPGGSSLSRLLTARRGARNLHRLPPLTVKQILAWADDYHGRTGRWPTRSSGVIPGTNGETWGGIDGALKRARRGLPPGLSLARLLAKHRRARP